LAQPAMATLPTSGWSISVGGRSPSCSPVSPPMSPLPCPRSARCSRPSSRR